MHILKANGAEEIYIKRGPCVYFLTDKDGEVLYIGKSKKSLFGRIASHEFDKQFSRVFFIECDGFNEMDKMELEFITKFNPRYNKKLPNPDTSEMYDNKQIKKMMGADLRIAKNASRHYEIPMIMIGSRFYFKKEIIQAIEKYVGQMKRKPLSFRPLQAGDNKGKESGRVRK